MTRALVRWSAIVATTALVLLAAGSQRSAHAAPQAAGAGVPILVVVDPADPFGRYYGEILEAEGLDEYAIAGLDALQPATLAAYRDVVLAPAALSDAQAAALAGWVQAGGDLVAMRPDPRLAGLLGLGSRIGSLAEGYIGVDTSAPPGAGITGTTMQFHGTADRWTTAGARTVAALYSTATTPDGTPAVTERSVGPNGGHAAAFTYDLARSVVETRQGNPAWAGQSRDGQIPPIRSDNLFFPDWVDFSRIQIPQADEQQRLLVNVMTDASTMPLPRFWYLPRGLRAAVVMTGDDHGHGGTTGRFTTFEKDSPPGCSVADWQCVRGTSYVYPGTPITDADVQRFQNEGFEIALHLTTGCVDYTTTSLTGDWDAQLPKFMAAYPSVHPPVTNRTHCITWSDWAGEPKAELAHGVRLDTNYYYWPGSWVADRPGLFTGSGFPMRFADLDGTPIDVYQATTQLTDESAIDIPRHIATLLDNALGPQGYYGVFTANMHTDDAAHPGADAIVAAAQARGVPVISAAQLLTWLDGRNGSTFQGLSFDGSRLDFTVAPGAGARGLVAMVPATSPSGGALTGLTRGGAPVAVDRQTIKGTAYATFAAAAGGYVATYAAVPAPGPTTGQKPSAGQRRVRATLTRRTVPVSRRGVVTLRLRCASGCRVGITMRHGARVIAHGTVRTTSGRAKTTRVRLRRGARPAQVHMRRALVVLAARAAHATPSTTRTRVRLRYAAPRAAAGGSSARGRPRR